MIKQSNIVHVIEILSRDGDEFKLKLIFVNLKVFYYFIQRFLHINTCFPGATHDAYVLRSSSVPAIMETLPEGGWLLGDSGYPLKEWLLTPFLSPSNPQEEKYNESLSKTRIVVERAFGVLKSRFRY